MKDSNDSIARLWFESGRIWIETASGAVHSQPLEAFPTLKDATEAQREDYYLWQHNQSIRWENIDEDIHITNFYEEETADYDNEVNRLLSKFPWLDLGVFADSVGMHKSKLDRYRYGIWKPSADTFAKIKEGLVAISREISAAVI